MGFWEEQFKMFEDFLNAAGDEFLDHVRNFTKDILLPTLYEIHRENQEAKKKG